MKVPKRERQNTKDTVKKQDRETGVSKIRIRRGREGRNENNGEDVEASGA